MACQTHRLGEDLLLVASTNLQADDVQACVELVQQAAKDRPVRLVIDLGQLTSYPPAARVAWQHALLLLRTQIREIVFVGASSPMVRVTASAVALGAAIPMRFVEALDDL